MATNFPTSLDSLTNPSSTDQLNSPSHSAQHTNANDAIEALQSKVGINSSAITTSHDYKISQLEAAITSGLSGTKSIYQDVRNQSGTSLTKGTPVYASGSDGASGKILITRSTNATEAGSSKTMGLTQSTISNNSNGQVITEGILEGIDTTGAVDGDPVWLGVDGAKIFGLTNKPSAPAHLVFLGIVIRGGQQNTGSIYVKIQNGFELYELHNVSLTDTQNKDALVYDSTTQLWKNYDLTQDFVSSTDVQNSLGDYIPLNTLGDPQGPAKLDVDGNLLIPKSSIIFEGSTADSHETTLTVVNPTSDRTLTLPDATGTIALTSDIQAGSLYQADPPTSPITGQIWVQSTSSYTPVDIYTTTQVNTLVTTHETDTTNVHGIADTSLLATKTYADTAASNAAAAIVNSAPSTLDTLNELSIALANDPNFATTVTNSLALKAPLASPTFTGTVTLPNNTVTNSMLAGSIANDKLANSSITINNFPISLGGAAAFGTDNIGEGTTNLYFTNERAQDAIGNSLGSGLSYNDGTGAISVDTTTIQSRVIDVSDTEIGYLNGVTSGIQTQIDSKLSSTTASSTYAPINSPTFTGTPLAPTATAGTNTTQIATTQFVKTEISNSVQPGSLYQADAPTSPATGQIWVESDSYSDSFDPNIIRRHTFTATAGQTNFVASVTFVDGYEQVYFNGLLLLRTTDYTTSGSNTVILGTAAAAGDIVEIVTVTNLNSVNTYTQAEIDSKIATEVNNLIASAPSALNTLDELAAALGDDANFASTVTTSLAGKKNEASSSISANTNLAVGTRYFVTSSSALTLTLPANPSVNDQIDIFDASGNASTYNITVARNGKLINGNAGNFIIDVNGSWYTLVFTGNTYGWKVA